MKLAEALMLRADLQRKLLQLQNRLTQNAQYQEGEQPSENPKELLSDYFQTSSELEDLIVKINRANHKITLSNGVDMLAALAKRDQLKTEQTMLIALANAAVIEQNRYSRSEIKMIPAVDIKTTRKKADDIAKKYRELDVLIQQANWQYDL